MARILVCEDSRTQAMHVRLILESVGHEVVLAVDGQHALAVLASDAFDLILSDVQMPGLTGFDLCRRIRGDNRHATVPVILMTTLRDMQDFRHGQEAGASTYIVKPFEPDDLLRRLDKVLPEDQRGTNRLVLPEDPAPVAPPSRPARPPSTTGAPPALATSPRIPSPATRSAPPPAIPPRIPSPTPGRSLHVPSTLLPPGGATQPAASAIPAYRFPSPEAFEANKVPGLPEQAPPMPGDSPLSQLLSTILSLTEQALMQSSDTSLRDLLLAIHQTAQKAADLPLQEGPREADEWPEASAPPAADLQNLLPPAPVLSEAPPTMLLLLEPADSLRRILQSSLERHGFRVLAAGGLGEGMRLCRDMGESIEVLIAEATESSGPLVETLRRLNPRAHLLYLVDQREPGQPEPMDLPTGAAMLQKPFTANTLLRKVLELLGRSPAA